MKTPHELILVLDDEPDMLRALKRILGHMGYRCQTETDPERAIGLVAALRPDVLLTDLRLPGLTGIDVLHRVRSIDPDMVVILITAYATIDTAVTAIRDGASDYVSKPIEPETLRRKIERHLAAKRSRERAEEIVRGSGALSGAPEAVGDAPAFRGLLERIDRIAGSDASVLLVGESGTGKEVLARRIHALSPRRSAPFTPIDCSALSETLLESELFGYEKGAFTGADGARAGLFEVADRGTVFLDEVGEVPPRLQSRLLRVLQERTFRRVGGREERRVDVRIIAATNRDIEQAVREGAFRSDLFYRLNCVTLAVPPLRERREDIPLLANHFLLKHASRAGRGPALTAEALESLTAHDWPGNVRELENAIVRATIFRPDGPIRPEDLAAAVAAAPAPDAAARAARTLDDVRRLSERAHIMRVLEATGGHRGNAATVLGISRKTLWEKMRGFDIA